MGRQSPPRAQGTCIATLRSPARVVSVRVGVGSAVQRHPRAADSPLQLAVTAVLVFLRRNGRRSAVLVSPSPVLRVPPPLSLYFCVLLGFSGVCSVL